MEGSRLMGQWSTQVKKEEPRLTNLQVPFQSGERPNSGLGSTRHRQTLIS